MYTRRCLIKVLGLLFAIGLCPWLSASSAFASSDVSAYSQSVFSDFDGDNKVDQAELFSNGTQKRIHVTLGKFAWKSLSFDSGVMDRGRLVSRDIDSDGDTDLIWVSEDYPKKFVTWLGDGRGNFELAPQAEQQLRHIEGLLWSDAQPKLVQDTDGLELSCVLITTNNAAIQTAIDRTFADSSEKSFSTTPTVSVFAPGFSDIRKRGPPSDLSWSR
jgi:hypothetical protein